MHARTPWGRAIALTAAALSPALVASSAHAGPERSCDCRDDDGDGAVDEGVDCLYDFEVEATADDWYDMALDGAIFGQNGTWSAASTWTPPVTAGRHLLSVIARDVQNVAQGFLAEVRSPYLGTVPTGVGFWRLQSTAPIDANWRSNGNGAFAPDNTFICPNPAIWGGAPASLSGADWVWAGGCDPEAGHPGDNYGIAEFEICPEASVCCVLEDGTTATVPAYACDDMGGTQTAADLCVEICCQLDDGTVHTTTVGTCEAKGGVVVPDEMCLPEACNCEDDDGDGLIDEGLDCEYAGSVTLTADDDMSVWLDGNFEASSGTWSAATTVNFAVPAGTHSLAVEARDTQWSLQGFLARVQPPFAAAYDTGDGLWWLSSVVPGGAAWRTTGAGLATNDAAALCANQAGWGGQPAALAGADWVWDGGCNPYTDPRQNAAYTEFEACIEAWVCCVLDDGTIAQTNAIECEFNGQIVPWDQCEEKPCDPIECPRGTTPVDTDGDGCDDACEDIGPRKG